MSGLGFSALTALIRGTGVALAALGLGACASTTKPCSTRGDVAWQPQLKGDQICYQVRRKDGTYVNHGAYKRFHSNGKVSLEGSFSDGEKHGVWTQYDDSGKKIRERYFENGVEKTAPTSSSGAEPVRRLDPSNTIPDSGARR